MVSYQLNPKFIDWDTEESYIFINPKLSKAEQKLIKFNAIPKTPGIIWMGSSGTTAEKSFKLLALPKKAFLNSAKAVCDHLQVTNQDIWLNVLPRFHVGGLSIEARAHISGCKVNLKQFPKFDVFEFEQLVIDKKVTITSLVPTQVFELIKNKIKAPQNLRIALVGGGYLSDELYQQAIALGWPVVLTYGMSEACSSVATSNLASIGRANRPSLEVLPHLQAKLNDEGVLLLKGESLSAGEVLFTKANSEFNQRQDEWLITNDMVKLNNNQLEFISRLHQQVKVSGELVNVQQLNNNFEQLKLKNNFNFTSQVIASPNNKYENQIDIMVEDINNLQPTTNLIKEFNQTNPRHQNINNTYFYKKIKCTELGKIIKPKSS